jgi:hypothetical protein
MGVGVASRRERAWWAADNRSVPCQFIQRDEVPACPWPMATAGPKHGTGTDETPVVCRAGRVTCGYRQLFASLRSH